MIDAGGPLAKFGAAESTMDIIRQPFGVMGAVSFIDDALLAGFASRSHLSHTALVDTSRVIIFFNAVMDIVDLINANGNVSQNVTVDTIEDIGIACRLIVCFSIRFQILCVLKSYSFIANAAAGNHAMFISTFRQSNLNRSLTTRAKSQPSPMRVLEQ